MDTRAEGDSESVAEDKSEASNKSGKRKNRPSPDPTISQAMKKKDLKKSPPQGAARRSDEQEKASVWQKVQFKQELKRQKKEMLSKQTSKEPRPEPKRKKPRKWIRPDALIIRLTEKANLSTVEFTAFLDRLTEDAKHYHPVAIAGDFNAWAVDWGSKNTNARGKELLEAFSTLDVVLLNNGDTPTYTKGDTSSIVDLTFVSGSLTRGHINWKVMDTYTASDHNAILWEILNAQSPRRPKKQLNTIGWKVKTLDPRALLVALNNDQIIAGCAEEKTKDLMKRVTQACDASMSRRRGINTRPSVHWWNDHISALRKECHQKRRISQHFIWSSQSSDLAEEQSLPVRG
ncbi:uncharacterized protein LOC123273744 [Cotesia glomerata]|uniref:uncharacterized protein LOC123273744 n=1 Tax=Cotesia glomerata TaxID=32391 RepID=UPI001D01FA9F|nr:uncharacterized protein LOC123273744 [Cotesia glomerata]